MTKVPELALELQREFDTMWTHSRDFALATPIAQELSTHAIDDESIPDDPDMNAHFTSKNFKVKGTTFSSTGTNAVADALVAAIQSAQQSIHIASGHLRSRPVAQALMAKAQSSPNVDIKVYLDGQEYISSYAHQDQQAKLDDCLANAGSSETKKRACVDKGFLYGYAVGKTGAAVRYKTYAYRWDNSYAKQMHNKFFVIDGKTLFTGSYNLSDNAEHDTFENVLEFRGAKHAALVQAYETRFAALWETGRSSFDALKQKIKTAATIPLVFDSIALTHQEVTELKDLVRDNCAVVDSTAYKQNAPSHQVCPRSGAPVAPPTGDEPPPPADEADNN